MSKILCKLEVHYCDTLICYNIERTTPKVKYQAGWKQAGLDHRAGGSNEGFVV